MLRPAYRLPRARLALGAGALVLLLAASAAPASNRAAAKPRVLVRQPTRVTGVAQSAGWIAWDAITPRYLIRRVTGGKVSQFYPGYGTSNGFVLAGSRLLWVDEDIGNTVWDTVLTATAGDREASEAYQVGADTSSGEGDHIGALAAGGGTLAFATVESAIVESTCDSYGYNCQTAEQPGAVYRVVDGKAVRVPHVPGWHGLAAAAARIAVTTQGSTAVVQVRRVTDGAVVSTIDAGAQVEDMALGDHRLVLLVAGATTSAPRTIRWYDPGTGARLGQVTAPGAVPLSLSGTRVVYPLRNGIRLLDTRTGKTRTIVNERHYRPTSVSIVGNRIVWLVHPPKTWLVKALDLPPAQP